MQNIDPDYLFNGFGSCARGYMDGHCKAASLKECAEYCTQEGFHGGNVFGNKRKCRAFTWTATAAGNNDCGAGEGNPACWLHDKVPGGWRHEARNDDSFRECYELKEGQKARSIACQHNIEDCNGAGW